MDRRPWIQLNGIVYRVAQSRGVLNHLLGRSLPSEQTGYDSVFLTSTGRLTSYSPDGEPNWQVNNSFLKVTFVEHFSVNVIISFPHYLAKLLLLLLYKSMLFSSLTSLRGQLGAVASPNCLRLSSEIRVNSISSEFSTQGGGSRLRGVLRQWVTSLSDLTQVKPIRRAKVRSQYLLRPEFN